MTNRSKELPLGVEESIKEKVRLVMDECDVLGIAWPDFHKAMLVEQGMDNKCSVDELFQRTFVRLRSISN